ncbi:MAG: lysophospholipid acyltransferase family protein [Planctomycetota bacterium]|nr:lysophospholipid acyltransferase family protein [Planctomycetota bacterium]
MNRLRSAWYAACQQVARVLFVTLFGVRVYHAERLPREGGVLVVSNHQSYLDPILVAVGMPRPFQPMARESLFRVAPFRWLIRSLYAFPVRRGTADFGAVREALRRLRAGAVVLMFPEGTRTRDGSIEPLQGGPVTVALRGGVPIVPMVIDGAFEAWPRTQMLPWPHRVRVACGTPVWPDEAAAKEPDVVMAAIRDQMLELQAELRRLRRCR